MLLNLQQFLVISSAGFATMKSYPGMEEKYDDGSDQTWTGNHAVFDLDGRDYTYIIALAGGGDGSAW
jgi:hypothetical protein